MPTSFQFNSTQLAEIKRLRDIATRPENKQVPGGGADLYRYIFKAVTGIDVTQSMLSTPIDTVWQANGNAPWSKPQTCRPRPPVVRRSS